MNKIGRSTWLVLLIITLAIVVCAVFLFEVNMKQQITTFYEKEKETIKTVLAITANVTGLLLWMPQAVKVWENQHNSQALEGVSIGTQVLAVINTLAWCLYGLALNNKWLCLGTVFTLPLAILMIIIKSKAKRVKVIETTNY